MAGLMTPDLRLTCPECRKVTDLRYSHAVGQGGQYEFCDADGQETADEGYVRYSACCARCGQFFDFDVYFQRVPTEIAFAHRLSQIIPYQEAVRNISRRGY